MSLHTLQKQTQGHMDDVYKLCKYQNSITVLAPDR